MTIEALGGYRLVRKLGEGARAEVFLGYPDDPDGQPAALKLFRPGVTQHEVMIEIEALSRAAGPHVVRLLDLASGPQGAPALILERLPGTSLAGLMRNRDSLRPGEAITILAPVLRTLGRMHGAGVTHGAIAASSVMFDVSGAPVLTCFGAAALHSSSPSEAELEANQAAMADIGAAIALVDLVLDRVHDDRAVELSAWAHAQTTDVANLAHELAARLFEWSDPLPIEFEARVAARSNLPHRALTAAPVRQTSTQASLAIPEWIARYLPSLPSVRPRVWAVGGAVAVALVVAVLAVPTGGSDATPEPVSAPTTAIPESPAEVAGDDPVAALTGLLKTRAQCIRDMSVLCLDAVSQFGSSALTADQQLVSELQDGGELPASWTVGGLTLEERLGDSALVSVDDPADSEPASFLLVKGEAGWRIRDYLWR